MPVTAKLSTSKFALSSSLLITPDASFTVKVASSLTAPVSATACGPTPVTVMTKFAVSVGPAPSLTVYVNVSVAVASAARPSSLLPFAT